MSEPMPSDAVLPSEPPAESTSTGGSEVAREAGDAAASTAARKKRRRGSRGGRNRQRSNADAANRGPQDDEDDEVPELPDRPMEGQIHDPEVAERVLVPRKPQIGDTMPAPAPRQQTRPQRPRRPLAVAAVGVAGAGGAERSPDARHRRSRRSARSSSTRRPSRRRRGRERNGRPIGRYLMCVHVRPGATQIAVLEGRNLIEHYVSPPGRRRQPDPRQHLPRPGAERAAGHGGGVRRHRHAEERRALPRRRAVRRRGHRREGRATLRIEQMLQGPASSIVCQVTKNPIGAKGARLTQEVSLPGRFVVLIPNSKHLRHLQAPARRRAQAPAQHPRPGKPARARRDRAHRRRERHADELERDVRPAAAAVGRRSRRTAKQGQRRRRCSTASPTRRAGDPRGVQRRVPRRRHRRPARSSRRSATTSPRSSPTLADRVEYYDPDAEALPLFERHHVHEQLHKALDRKVWLPSGGSLIIEHTEALTVIDVNTGKNVGTSSLEETVFRNNLEAAEEIARQLRLRDIGGIIVIDFIDMEIRENRDEVVDGVPRRPRPRQDPHAGVRHLRARPGRDDPQAHRRGPARVALAAVPDVRGPRRRVDHGPRSGRGHRR